MSKILLSIQPQYAQQILEGTKKYEYRRICPKKKVSHVILYVTAPMQCVVAEVEVSDCLVDAPKQLLMATMGNSNYDREKLIDYYTGCETGCAFVLGEVHVFNPYKKLSDFGLRKAPRSFVYLEQNELEE